MGPLLGQGILVQWQKWVEIEKGQCELNIRSRYGLGRHSVCKVLAYTSTENQAEISSTHTNMTACIYNPSTWDRDGRIPGAHWLSNLTKSASSQVP